jgi:hypothetical protein
MLHFTADPRHLPAAAQDRLRVLTVQAERVGPPPGWNRPPPPAAARDATPPKRRGIKVPCLFVVITLTVFAALVAIGIYRVVTWLIGL